MLSVIQKLLFNRVVGEPEGLHVVSSSLTQASLKLQPSSPTNVPPHTSSLPSLTKLLEQQPDEKIDIAPQRPIIEQVNPLLIVELLL